LASAHAAAALGVAEGTPLIARTRLVEAEIGPVELSTVYLPVELASGTEVGKDAPIPGGLLRHIVQVKGIEFDHAVQRISARHATTEEASRLKIRKLDVVLTLLLVAYDRAGVPLLCVDAVLPASRHELEDAFPLS
jgi:GntR family transcriptional regulator